MSRTLLLLPIVVALVTSTVAPSARAAEALRLRIVDVTTTTVVMSVSAPNQNMDGVRLRKFVPETQPAWMAVLRATWEADKRFPVPGALVSLQYRLNEDPAARTIERREDQPVSGRRTTKFVIPLGAQAEHRVTAWRLQLIQGGRVIDERRSASWR